MVSSCTKGKLVGYNSNKGRNVELKRHRPQKSQRSHKGKKWVIEAIDFFLFFL
jgi:hypothetical protein